jgi:hypothetical protein
MPNALLNMPTPQALADQISHLEIPQMTPMEPEKRGVNIRGVPYAIWQRARQNALLSGLPFKTYVIRLLAHSEPFPPGAVMDEDEEME